MMKKEVSKLPQMTRSVNGKSRNGKIQPKWRNWLDFPLNSVKPFCKCKVALSNSKWPSLPFKRSFNSSNPTLELWSKPTMNWRRIQIRLMNTLPLIAMLQVSILEYKHIKMWECTKLAQRRYSWCGKLKVSEWGVEPELRMLTSFWITTIEKLQEKHLMTLVQHLKAELALWHHQGFKGSDQVLQAQDKAWPLIGRKHPLLNHRINKRNLDLVSRDKRPQSIRTPQLKNRKQLLMVINCGCREDKHPAVIIFKFHWKWKWMKSRLHEVKSAPILHLSLHQRKNRTTKMWSLIRTLAQACNHQHHSPKILRFWKRKSLKSQKFQSRNRRSLEGMAVRANKTWTTRLPQVASNKAPLWRQIEIVTR